MEVRVAHLTAPRVIEWRVSELSENGLSPTELLCETRYSCISPGTEVAAFVGAPPLRPGPIYPRLVGYCNLATVVEVGSGVTKAKPGDLVLTHQSHRSGFVVGEGAVLATVNQSANLAKVSAAYLFHLAYAALLKAHYTPGHKVAVVGLGTLGLAATALLRALGGNVVAYSGQSNLAGKACSIGANALLAKDDSSMHASFDIVVSTSNLWDDWNLALRLAGPGGTIAMLGFPGRGQEMPASNPLASEYVYDKQLTIVACGQVPNIEVSPQHLRFTLKRNMEWLVQLITTEALHVDHIVSDVVEPEQLGSVYERLASREEGLVTAVLKW